MRGKQQNQRALIAFAAALLLTIAPSSALAQKRLVIIDQDAVDASDSGEMSMLALLQSPQVDVLGITMVTGDGWRDEGMQHTLRMLELTNHANVPVFPGAVFPLVRTQEETRLDLQRFGKVTWLGAWNDGGHGPAVVPPLPEGAPSKKPADEDAAHFLVRQVHAHPGEVTIYAAGPFTNIALALAIDPGFAEATRGIVMMGGSLNPQTDDPEFATAPRHEFNFWFDPEATRKVLRAHWPRIDVTTVDVSIKTKFSDDMFAALGRSKSPAAQYIVKYSKDRGYMWDELAACAWLDPSLITKTRDLYLDVDVSHGPSYGDTLTWTDAVKPAIDLRLTHAQVDVDMKKFAKMFVDLMSATKEP
ncbi:MAG TPA: nucleoside hydrolase [Vicinamibacterales bacterium]|nr:nucleoside hydrolase [Vicinamibacterales bacterium]